MCPSTSCRCMRSGGVGSPAVNLGCRQTDSQTDRQPVRQTDSQSDRQSDRQSVRQTDSQSVSQSDSQSVRQTDRQSDRQTDIQSDRQTDSQAPLVWSTGRCFVLCLLSSIHIKRPGFICNRTDRQLAAVDGTAAVCLFVCLFVRQGGDKGRMALNVPTFWILKVDGYEGSASRPSRFIPEKVAIFIQ
jgi:hypothetical protein